MTQIINFVAGPGAGKSTLAGELFGWMKRRRYNCEYVAEFAKDLTWRKASGSLDDQFFIFGEQHHRIYTLLDQVDYIITDCPLILSIYYTKFAMSKYKQNPLFEHMMVMFEMQVITITQNFHNNKFFFVERGDRKFIQAGRNQNEEESRIIDEELKALMQTCCQYTNATCLEDVLKEMKFETNQA